MRITITCLALALCATISSAQVVDTILFENFQTDKFGEWGTVPLGDDATWVSFDEDGLPPYDGDDNHRAWYFSQFFYNAEDTLTGEVNYCAASHSYLEGFAIGNRNWLITPPIQVTNSNYTLHWKSAPFQLPRYMDGYVVMAAVGSNDLFSNVFTDTLFQAASMDAITGTGNSINLSNFTFTPGYIHADSLRNDDYVDLYAPGDSTLLRGILEQHSVSLGQYAGQTIYLAFLHNADDDYFMAVDDILVTRSQTSGAGNGLNEQDFRFVTYPNPVVNNLNVMYRLPEAAEVSVSVRDITGKTVIQQPAAWQLAGEYQTDLNLTKLPSGTYTVSLQIGHSVLSKKLNKA